MKRALALVAAHVCALVFLVLAGLTLSARGDEQSAEVPPIHDMVLTDGKNTVRLAAGPCIHAGTLALLKPESRPQFHKATAMFRGKFFYACWKYEEEGEDGPRVVVLYEDGDLMRYDPKRFKPDVGI
jgi:hypothetical protein